MDLLIDGALHRLIPIKQFRAEQALPERFGVDAFTPKDWTELGRLDSAGTELNELRAALLASLPSHLTPTGWMNQLPDYVRQFDKGLRGLNAQVGLRESEIEFAVAGLSDVLHAHAMSLIRGDAYPAFSRVYQQWLYDSVRVFSEGYPYVHQGVSWTVHILSHAYGRIGLRVTLPDARYYVLDSSLACPAEGYMQSLLQAIGDQLEAIMSPRK